MVDIARALDVPVNTVHRIAGAFAEGGIDQVKSLKWGRGREAVNKASKEEIEWLVAPETLKQQEHLSMEQRTQAFNQLFDQELTARDVRELYTGHGVSKQRFTTTLGPPKPTFKHLEKQRVALELAQ